MLSFITEFEKKGKVNTLSEYLEIGGFTGLNHALQNQKESIVHAIKESGLRGRGGAYFPTGTKWETFANTKTGKKFIVCNADEGEPGTFKDRYLLDRNCWLVLEGMIIAAYATGSSKGILYLRGEYASLKEKISAAIHELEHKHFLGDNILGGNFSFSIELHMGAGAYICGEESALLESIEGKRGVPRNKPPFPVSSGLQNMPTLIQNVETFANIPQILRYGSQYFRTMGTKTCPGTKLICVSGCTNKTGVFEIPFGISMQTVLDEVCGGVLPDKQIKFVQIGGIGGKCFIPEELDCAYDIDGLKSKNASVGTGAIYYASQDVDILEYLRFVADFYKSESCGRCTPCREGTYQLALELEKMGKENQDEVRALKRIAKIIDTMAKCSACGLGQAAPTVLTSLLGLYHLEREGLKK